MASSAVTTPARRNGKNTPYANKQQRVHNAERCKLIIRPSCIRRRSRWRCQFHLGHVACASHDDPCKGEILSHRSIDDDQFQERTTDDSLVGNLFDDGDARGKGTHNHDTGRSNERNHPHEKKGRKASDASICRGRNDYQRKKGYNTTSELSEIKDASLYHPVTASHGPSPHKTTQTSKDSDDLIQKCKAIQTTDPIPGSVRNVCMERGRE